MILSNLKRVDSFETRSWVESIVPELTPYQKSHLSDIDSVRFTGYYLYKEREKVKGNFFIRATVVFVPIVWLILLMGFPINFVFTGSWGYSKIEWFLKWANKLGINI